ncbi:MAG: hypothetical protein ACRDNT_16755 [Streptosporangiaceae bacterium]
MADRRDDLDAWLGERIDPLPPPPGTFELIKRQARRRKYRRLAITATSAAVIVAAAVTVPQVVNLPVRSPNPTSAAPAGQSSSATPTVSGSRSESSASASSAVPVPAPVPANFRPSSVTFVGTDTGWVIGQASTPGHCATQYCTSVARTDDAGQTWAGVPAPLTGAPDGATGVSRIRFLNLHDGWAFGPELFVTDTGGETWAPVDTHGLRVTDLETVGHRVFALWASCTGRGPTFATQCTSFTLYSAPAAGGNWAPVGAATTGLTDGAADEAASLVLTGSRGYLLAPGGALYAGPADGSAAWQRVSSLVSSCLVGPAQPDGQPAGALLGAVNARELILACVSGSSGGSPDVSRQQKLIYSSPNGGVSWLQVAKAPDAGVAFSLAASPSETVVLGTDQGIDLLPAGDIAWQTATLTGGKPAGGFAYVGMTTDKQGIALPADPSAGTVWFTFDGGQSWQASPLAALRGLGS